MVLSAFIGGSDEESGFGADSCGAFHFGLGQAY
jgi:hypothetical protein